MAEENQTLYAVGKTTAPTTGDDSADNYVIGSRWIDETNDKEYVCLDNTAGAAVWKETTQSGSSFGFSSQISGLGSETGTVANDDTLLAALAKINDRLRIESNVVDISNSTNAQTVRIHGTKTDASNYERLSLSYDGTYYNIGTEAAGTGTQRGLELNAATWLALKLGGTWCLALYQNQVRLSKTLGTGGASIDIGTASERFRHGYFNLITAASLPTSDPSVDGQFWNDGGTVKVSAG